MPLQQTKQKHKSAQLNFRSFHEPPFSAGLLDCISAAMMYHRQKAVHRWRIHTGQQCGQAWTLLALFFQFPTGKQTPERFPAFLRQTPANNRLFCGQIKSSKFLPPLLS